MKRRLTNNLGLKFLAVICSFFLWLIVVNINDPVDYQQFSGIQVELINTDAITDEGKVYEILDNTNVITVTISAKRSILDTLNRENIRAVADLSEVTITNTVNIRLSTNRYNSSIESITSNTEYLRLNIEDIRRKQLRIETVTTGTPAEGYLVGSVTTDQNVVRLSGPESVITQIASAQVVVDVSGMNENISTSADLRLYDADGRIINSSSVTENIDSVNVNVLILATKQVPIVYRCSGTPAEGYALTGEVRGTPDEVLIAGTRAALDRISAIEIPETAINVNGQTENLQINLNLNDYLPNGISLADSGFSGIALVEVFIEPIETVYLPIPQNMIELVNVPEGFSAAIVGYIGNNNIGIRGIPSVLDQLDPGIFSGTVDIYGYLEERNLLEPQAGTYVIPADFTMPDNVVQVQGVVCEIELTALDEED